MPAHVHVMFTRLRGQRYDTAPTGLEVRSDDSMDGAGWSMTGHLKLLHHSNNPSPTFPQEWIDSITDESCAELYLPTVPLIIQYVENNHSTEIVDFRLDSSAETQDWDMDDVEMSDVGAVGEGAKTDEEKVMADSGVAATVSVSLHPLVIMNISEHWTR